ncbi:hypothetical protein PYW08_015972 [Mythimna loreyi]|uniref:Uncharacterized protein n=1 Tax=Mythimna loreyi TaxID=667449 RepID=A0ACC2QXC7_9NEOP|nr:hypothetical protein PYW08_015972 [Mythimna loreyi]
MNKYLVNSSIMQRNAAVLTILCILLCLTFNYTFPLHREGSNLYIDVYGNRSHICARIDHRDGHKKIARDAFKKMDSKLDTSQNAKAQWNDKNDLSEEDLRQYEQLVIMKKYPYLDLKEIELKYNSPSDKNTRQSGKYDAGSSYVGDSSFCEPFEDAPNVEIINRGLTGFAIPAKIIKSSKLLENKLKLNNLNGLVDSGSKYKIKLAVSSTPYVSQNLHSEIGDFEEKK